MLLLLLALGISTSAAEIWRVRTNHPVIALTFDDGPKPETTIPLLELLEKADVRATFFIVGRTLADYPDLAHRIVSSGHELANHTFSHPDLRFLSDEAIDRELAMTSKVIQKHAQTPPQFFRPPGGKFTKRVLARVASQNMVTAFWDINAADYAHETRYGVKNELNLEALLEKVRPGSIILMHNGNPFTLAQLPDFIQKLRDRGYDMVPLRELLRYKK